MRQQIFMSFIRQISILSIISSIFYANLASAQEAGANNVAQSNANILPTDSFLLLEFNGIPLVMWIILSITSTIILSITLMAMISSRMRAQHLRNQQIEPVRHIYRADKNYGHHRHFD